MSRTDVHDRPTTEHHEVYAPPRVIVTARDVHLSDEDMTSEQTAHASETSQAEGERGEDED